ncbi:MAG: tRNA (adenosine(37)-N6)-dimethylallyltransferase MiaA [Nitrospirae bacterium]|nr:tRNA (adenosine(37)-N6)-dimethylallyltransferase MiaA [Nitrospirota bacterium]
MNKVIILLGPTGVGKTAVSILLAKALDTEIISADSMQIYKGMDIGTAKPSLPELKEVRHHLISILSSSEHFSAGMFRDRAVKIIDELHRRGKIPVVAGGTGLYIKTLTRGLFEGPPADWHLREELLEEEKLFGKNYLYEKLKRLDPVSADKIKPQDTRRIIRALEVSLKGEKTISEFQHSGTTPQNYEFIKIGLLRDRKELYGMIEQRVDKMMEAGLVDEVREILKLTEVEKMRGSADKRKAEDKSFITSQLLNFIPSALSSMQSLGYKEISLYLDGLMSLEDAVKLLKKRTKMYAKRQFTWFKKEPDIRWMDITGIVNAGEILLKIMNEVSPVRKLMPDSKWG